MSVPVDGVTTATQILAHLASNVSQTGATLVLGGNGIVGLGLALVCFFLSLLGTWVILRVTLTAYGAAARKADPKNEAVQKSDGPGQLLEGEGFLLVRLDDVGIALWAAAVTFVTSAIEAFSNALFSLVGDWMFLIGILIAAAIALVWNLTHDIILEVGIAVWQCSFRPVLDFTIFPLLNLVRALFAFAWPVVNGWTDIMAALTYGNLYIIFKCTPETLIRDFTFDVLLGLKALATTLVEFIVYGLLHNGRWDMISGLNLIQEAINTTSVIFTECYCIDLDPVWTFVYGIVTAPSLAIFIDCATNIPIRSTQIILNIIFNFNDGLSVINLSNWAEEQQCAALSLGDWAQDIFLLFIEMLQGLYDLAASLVSSMSVAERQLGFTRVAVLHAVAQSTMDIPYSMRLMMSDPGAVPMRASSLAWFAAVDDSLRTEQGYNKKLFQFSAFGVDDPDLDSVSASAFHFTPPVSTLPIILVLGLDALLRVANTPWSRIIVGPYCVSIGIFNLTINAAFHPNIAFANSSGISYFQYGTLGDFTRQAVNALVELLAFFDAALPCTFSKPLQVLASIPEILAEWFTAGVYSWAFPPWEPGVPPPTNCSIVNCSSPPPDGWSPLDFWARYYAWNASVLRVSFERLLEGGECTAFLLGCNTTAENNNSTNITSNCTDSPLACTARSLNRVFVSVLNLTFAFILYAPDLVRFNASYATFNDLPINESQIALEGFILCIGLLLDELDWDGDRCLTATPPDGRPDNPNITLPGDPEVGVFQVPPRTEWECHLDGGAYYWDQRGVVILNATDAFALNATQLLCAINGSRLCSVALSDSVQVLGSAPDDNVTLVFSPQWIDDDNNLNALAVQYNATTGVLLTTLSNASTLLATYGVTSYTQSDCTDPTTPPTPVLSREYACATNGTSNDFIIYTQPFAQFPFKSQAYASYAFTNTHGNTNSYPCTTDMIFTNEFFCGSGNHLFVTTPVGVRPVYTQVQYAGQNLTDLYVNCTGNASAVEFFPPNIAHTAFFICEFNTISYLPFYQIGLDYNKSLVWPVYYYLDAPTSTTRQNMPCINTAPNNYTCQNIPVADLNGMVIDGGSIPNDVLFSDNLDTAEKNVFQCSANPLTTSPNCTRIIVGYANGANVTVELLGGEVYVYGNGTKEPVPCLYSSILTPSTNGTTNVSAMTINSAALAAEDDTQPLPPTTRVMGAAVPYMTFKQQVQYAQQVSLLQYLRRDTRVRDPVLTRVQLDVMLASREAVIQSVAGTAELPRVLRLLVLAADTNSSVFRKQTFICCLSEVVTLSLQAIVDYVYAILYLYQGLLTLPAIPNITVPIPTFEATRDALRAALCRLACTISDLLPFDLTCPNSGLGNVTCGTLTVCGRNLLCDVFDLPILIADFIVATLTLIKALIEGDVSSTPDALQILGPTCTYKSPGSCVVSFLTYIVTHTTQAVTMVMRTTAAVGDCLLCSIEHLVAPESPCVPAFSSVIDELADAIDAIMSTVITAVLNFTMGVFQTITYLLAGQFEQSLSAFVTEVLGSLLILFNNLRTIIITFIEKIPVIGPLFTVIFDVVGTSCHWLQDALSVFGAGNIGCPANGIKKRKRTVEETGWMTGLWPNVTYVWSHEATTSCFTRMVTLNQTDKTRVMEDDSLSAEVMYCIAAHLWVGPTATPEATSNYPRDECDVLMTGAYTQGYTWGNMGLFAQTRVRPCIQARLDAEKSRADGNYSGSWFPHNTWYTGWRTPMQLLDDAMYAHGVWNQYMTDYNAPAEQIVNPEYQDAWVEQGYSVDHLVNLTATAQTAGDVYYATGAAEGAFSIDAYAARAVSLTQKRQLDDGTTTSVTDRPRNVDRIAGIMRYLWKPLYNGTSTQPGLVQYVLDQSMDQIEARHKYADTSVPLTANLIPRIFAANDPRLLQRLTSGMVNVAFKDVPAIVLTIVRTPGRVYQGMKRGLSDLTPNVTLPWRLYNVMVGSLVLVRDLLGSAKNTTRDWIRSNTTRDWLAAEATAGHLHDPGLVASGAAWQQRTLVGAAASRLWAGMTQLFVPLTRVGERWGRVLDYQAQAEQASGRFNSATWRRLSISRFMARTMLLASEGSQEAAYQRMRHTVEARQLIRSAETNNVTNVTCLFAVSGTNNTNDTSNLTYPLCNTCFGLDQIFGRAQRATYGLLYFYGVAVPTCLDCPLDEYPSLNYSITQYQTFQDYITNPAATVVVGYSTLGPVPVSWPNPKFPALSWFDDPTPNKTGFSDLGALINATWQFLKAQLTAADFIIFPTFGPGGIVFSSAGLTSEQQQQRQQPPVHEAQDLHTRMVQKARVMAKLTADHAGPIVGPVMQMLQASMALGLAVTNSTSMTDAMDKVMTAGITRVADVSVASVGPFTTWTQVLQAWLDYIISQILCPWQELYFNAKRFSLGYTLIFGLFAFFLIACVSEAVSHGNLLMVLMFSATVVGLTLLVTWLLITYQYGLLCFPALPLGVGDDFMYLLGYSLLPKCLIFFGVTNAPYYSNNNCYACSHWTGGWFPIPNYWLPLSLGGLYGFSDLRYNIAFILKAGFPTLWTALRPGGSIYTLRGLTAILSLSFFQEPLGRFAGFDPATATETQYRTYWLGATFVTFIPNLIILTAFVYLILRLFGPVFWQFLNFLLALFALLLPLILFLLTGLYMIGSYDSIDPMNPATQRLLQTHNTNKPVPGLGRKFARSIGLGRKKREAGEGEGRHGLNERVARPGDYDVDSSYVSSSSILLI